MPDVVFRPEVENLRNDRQRAWYGAPCLTDHGDHVEYFDGQQTHHWRLPGQSGDGPVLGSVQVIGVQFPVSTKIANYTIGFYDQDGALLSRLSHRPRLNFEQFEATLPDSAFAGLAQRGVQIKREQFADGPRFYQAHPEFTGSTSQRRYQQHPLVWIAGALVLIVIVVNVILLATGYYS